MELSLIFLLVTGLVVSLADSRVQQYGVIHEIKRGVAGPNPYIFLSIPNGRSQSIVQGFEVIEEEEDAEDDADEPINVRQKVSLANIQNDDDDEEVSVEDDDDSVVDGGDDDDDDEMEAENSSEEKVRNPKDIAKNNALMKTDDQSSQMLVTREDAGAIMVPDEIIEIEGQNVIDPKTGKSALLLPRSVLDSIPDGSVVALLEKPEEATSEERANRVVVRRRRKGSRRNVKRRRVNNNFRRRRGGGNRRRRVANNRVRVVRVNGNRRRNVRRGGNRRRVVYQG